MLELMEARPEAPKPIQAALIEEAAAPIVTPTQVPPLPQAADRAKRRREPRSARASERERLLR
jgi:hypothetical protein